MASSRQESATSAKNIRILVITLFFAVLFALAFIKIIILLDLKEYLTLVVPLLPVFYTIIYPILDRPFLSDEHKKAVESSSHKPIMIVTPSYFSNLSYFRILGGVLIALLIKFVMEFSQYAMLSFLTDGGINVLRKQIDFVLIMRIVKGDLVVSHILFLLIEMILMSCAGGIWVGYTSRKKPVMEGMIAGTILSVIIGFTNLTPLYHRINEVASQWTGFLNSKVHIEILAGVITFTFLFSCWVLAGMRLKTVHLKSRKPGKKGKSGR